MDLAVRHGFTPPRRYQVEVQLHDAEAPSFETAATRIPLGYYIRLLGEPDADDVDARLVVIAVRSQTDSGERWAPEVRVTVYLKPDGNLRIAAVERDA